MYAEGISHPWLKAAIAEIRHTEMLVICDAGLPDDNGHSRVIDLAVLPGVPRFADVAHAVAAELVYEGITYAEEVDENPRVDPAVRAAIHALADVIEVDHNGTKRVDSIPHEDFKKLANQARVIVRTGEQTPYANLIFHGGVPF